jgi:glycosyltransferase involved in cell wall biosynthesis
MPSLGEDTEADRSARILFIAVGDIRQSRGARTYLFSLVDALRGASGSVHAFFLQQVIAAPAEIDWRGGPMTIMLPPGERYAATVPNLVWRLYEVAWAVWMVLGLALTYRMGCSICLVTGPILLPLTPVLRRFYRTVVYIEHGIAEELLVSGSRRGWVKYRFTRLLERAFLRRFDAITVVSTKMGEYFRQRDGVTRHLLVPCSVDPRKLCYSAMGRAELRVALGVGDRFVFVYSGGADLWQRRSEIVEFFRVVRTSIENAFLLVLSADPGPWRETLRTLDPRDYAVVSVGHAEVGRHLSLADAALLMRTRRLVDFVSCPVKFAEYLACGLPIVISPDIGDYSALVAQHAVGVVVDPDDRSTWEPAVEALRVIVRDPATQSRCLGLARQLSWDIAVARLLAALADGSAPQRASPGPDPSSDDTPGLPTRRPGTLATLRASRRDGR